MSKDIRELLKKDAQLEKGEVMPKGHEDRFFNKLEKAIPKQKSLSFSWYSIAASLLLFMALGIGTYNYLHPEKNIDDTTLVNAQTDAPTKTLGDISPDLKKVEEHYLASINLELSKVKITPENREMFDGYINRLEILNQEYEKLSLELSNQGPNEQTVNALISNLKLRLNLMQRLSSQLKRINTMVTNQG